MENFPYLFAAYTLVWLVTFGYILSLLRRQADLRKEIDYLKKALKKGG